MTQQSQKLQEQENDFMKITVTKNGPYIVTGGVPIVVAEICNDNEGYCRTWKIVDRYPVKEQSALCRCGHSENRPFCDGTHAKTRFNGTETAGNEPYLSHPEIIRGPELELTDYHGLCVHARFCMRAGGIWNLTEQSGNPEARDIAIEEACNCPSGRLVIRDLRSGELVEPVLEKSIVVIEYPAKGEHGPLWVRGGIPVVSADGKPYTIRNRVTLCRCGKSHNKPFCDGSHVQH
jgi:CDGSH-type Zn-finger protein